MPRWFQLKPAVGNQRGGDIIGRTGNTGTPTGPHLHLGLVPARPNWGNGTFGSIDPMRWLTLPFVPNSYTAWTGTDTSGTGSSTTTAATAGKDWLSMAIEAELRKIIREEVAGLPIPAKGKAKGTMTLAETLGWDSHERTLNEPHRVLEQRMRENSSVVLRTIVAGVSKILTRTEKDNI